MQSHIFCTMTNGTYALQARVYTVLISVDRNKAHISFLYSGTSLNACQWCGAGLFSMATVI